MVTIGKTHIEHNGPALPLIADIAGDMAFSLQRANSGHSTGSAKEPRQDWLAARKVERAATKRISEIINRAWSQSQASLA
jgi:hypothetical protein